MNVGILALQGAFAEHETMLHNLGVTTTQVRLPAQLEQIDRLIIPGGESTAIGKLLETYQLLEPLKARAQAGMPVWGTCAGMILLAREITEGRREGQPALGLMDITARRNAFGRQLDSFEQALSVPMLGEEPFPAVFIRAPQIDRVGPDVEILAELEDGRIVAARQGHFLATAFHPELTRDDRFHRLFLEL
ncbi:MAG: pyridoxal 5'-phosphate synthase glutaminase subunit PdxT [Herpetosiphonaceae bacterium]|nr:pyridoxal 5'-phosphate synthase glutaminase subunit PdxT [Herpetosiphonaceae bacterium]